MPEAVLEPQEADTGAPEATATWVVTSGGNDIFWRCEAPAAAVGGKVVKVPNDRAEDAFLSPNTDTPYRWSIVTDNATADGVDVFDTREAWDRFTQGEPRILKASAVFADHEGVAVFPRPCLARATLMRSLKDQGVLTVTETDDNYFTPPAHSLFMRQTGNPEQMQLNHARAMCAADRVVVSTHRLGEIYQKQFRARFGKKGLPEIFVCRNHIHRDMWPDRVEHDGPLRVGFMGSPSHVWDVNLAYAAFHAAKQLGCETWMVGYNPADPDPDMPDELEVDGETIQTRSPASLAAKKKWAAVVDKHVRWIDPVDYHRAPIPFDIGIAPLWHNQMTEGKSDVKAIEHTISGIVSVLASTPVYTGVGTGWVHNENCLLANSPEEYAVQTIRLIKDAKLRERIVHNARQYVSEERNETVMAAEWSTALGL